MSEPAPVVGPRSLINEDGSSFTDELDELIAILDGLSNDDRENFRDRNALDIANNPAPRLLVVAGPGSGKSYLFLERIKYWLRAHPEDEIYVSSFVAKLVRDLRNDVKGKKSKLSPEDQKRVEVTTLHSLARSLIERNKGTKSHPLLPHIQIIAEPWNDVVWLDVLQFHPDVKGHGRRSLESQFHTGVFDDAEDASKLRNTYMMLCRFYNAAGFADMITLATTAIAENPDLVAHQLWIVDEYQDFNAAEDALITAITHGAAGVLLAGDDEQALYQDLKASHPEIIVSYYANDHFANGMLPYCSRCSYHVTVAASEFIAHDRPDGAIPKIYLPLRVDEDAPRVQLVATAAPSAAVSYIAKFIEDHRDELEAYQAAMIAGEETDPFLMILTPQKKVKFFQTKGADTDLRAIVDSWRTPGASHSPDYKRVAIYYAAGKNPADNFAIRKALEIDDVLPKVVHGFIEEALERRVPLAEVASDVVRATAERALHVSDAIDVQADAADTVSRLEELIRIADPTFLAIELAADPIGIHSVEEQPNEELDQSGPSLSPVELMTLVGSKGLSAQHVMILGCDNVNMAKMSRLTFYVGMTRARKTLHLLTALQAGGSTTCAHHLHDLPPAACDYVYYAKGKGVIDDLGSFAALKAKFETLAWVKTQPPKKKR